ncbi:MAG: hypothetical protein FH756_18570 [Firmicutes bacterium]|nr:hypothetical protein [Bacillota bacterium]
MILKFIENEGDILTRIVQGENETEFNYITFIELLFNGEKIEDSIYEGDITEISRQKLQEMLSRINSIVVESQQETMTFVDNVVEQE